MGPETVPLDAWLRANRTPSLKDLSSGQLPSEDFFQKCPISGNFNPCVCRG